MVLYPKREEVRRSSALSEKVERAFPVIEMPLNDALLIHGEECDKCSFLRQVFEELRGSANSEEIVDAVYMEMANMTPLAWNWVLSHYVRYFLWEGSQGSLAREFFVFKFNPSTECEETVRCQLAYLSEEQLDCISQCLVEILDDEVEREVLGDDVFGALTFLDKCKLARKNG